MALGATRGQIARLFIRRGMMPTAAGLIGGIVLALAASRLVRSELYGVRVHDPLLYAASTLALGCVATAACWIPVRRAMKVDPMVALRHE